jgi:PAS domain S-box-containing protein
LSVAQPLVQASLVGEAIDRGPVAVFVADDEMRYVAVNAFACELLGYTREELLELRVPDVARRPEASEHYAEMLATRAQTGTVVLSRKDGAEVGASYFAQETTVAGMTFYVSVAVVNGSAASS